MPRREKSYRDKRDLERTNEPLGDDLDRRGRSPTWRGAFVVHQHDATRMHFDLRLEIGGALASFAIPHGPTLDPEAKHLAMQTEDHPIEYLDFEDVIPEGTYGAGPMIAWDLGSVRYLDEPAEQGLVSGKLHFSLEGRKLRGRFGLVRIADKRGPGGDRTWLLIKKQDAHASKRPIAEEAPRSVLSGLTVGEMLERSRIGDRLVEAARGLGAVRGRPRARDIHPMLCTLAEVPPSGPGWLFELKMDGVRAIAEKSPEGVSIRYRSGRVATSSYPEVERAVRCLPVDNLVLDGELVAFDDAGKPSFERLASRIHRTAVADLRHALTDVPVVFFVFDLLGIGDLGLLDLPLVERKRLLQKLVPAAGVLRVLDHLEGQGDALLQFCRDKGLEGVVSKRADAPYVQGPGRTNHWLKTKCTREDCFVVVGFTQGEGSRKRLGALEIAAFEGDDLVHRGRVGSGLQDDIIDDLLKRLGPLRVEGQTAKGVYEATPKVRVHVLPKIAIRVRYLELSDQGHVRFPVYLGIEHDLDIRECRVTPHDEDHVGAPEEKPAEPPVKVNTTNRTKVFWPEEGYTKGDLLDYYEAIAPFLLPYLDDRPIMLVRYPDGIDGKSFYQWNVPHGMPSWVRSVVLGKHVMSADEGDQKKHVFLIDRVESLLYVANLACIPIHILGSRVAAPTACDFLTIDFDIGKSSFATATRLASTLRGVLEAIGLFGVPKTSGQSGLHVFVSLGDGVSPAAARTLAELLGKLVVDAHKGEATMERVVARRGDKVYVDTGQTGPSRTIVAPFSVRATKGARVSTPLTWDELASGVDPAAFTIRTVPDRVARSGDPMRGWFTERPDMTRVMSALAQLLGNRR